MGERETSCVWSWRIFEALAESSYSSIGLAHFATTGSFTAHVPLFDGTF